MFWSATKSSVQIMHPTWYFQDYWWKMDFKLHYYKLPLRAQGRLTAPDCFDLDEQDKGNPPHNLQLREDSS